MGWEENPEWNHGFYCQLQGVLIGFLKPIQWFIGQWLDLIKIHQPERRLFGFLLKSTYPDNPIISIFKKKWQPAVRSLLFHRGYPLMSSDMASWWIQPIAGGFSSTPRLMTPEVAISIISQWFPFKYYPIISQLFPEKKSLASRFCQIMVSRCQPRCTSLVHCFPFFLLHPWIKNQLVIEAPIPQIWPSGNWTWLWKTTTFNS